MNFYRDFADYTDRLELLHQKRIQEGHGIQGQEHSKGLKLGTEKVEDVSLAHPGSRKLGMLSRCCTWGSSSGGEG